MRQRKKGHPFELFWSAQENSLGSKNVKWNLKKYYKFHQVAITAALL